MRAAIAAIPLFFDPSGCLAPPAEVPDDCGITPEVVPDFALEDANPNSATYGQIVSRDDLMGGDVMFLYWAQAT